MILFQSNILAKLEYFTNLDFPEIAGAFPFPNATFWGPSSCEVAIIWPEYWSECHVSPKIPVNSFHLFLLQPPAPETREKN